MKKSCSKGCTVKKDVVYLYQQTMRDMKTNNTNDFSKRTQSQIDSILISNGVLSKPESLGDGRTFYVHDSGIKTRFALKKAGFILELSKANDKGLIFKAY